MNENITSTNLKMWNRKTAEISHLCNTAKSDVATMKEDTNGFPYETAMGCCP